MRRTASEVIKNLESRIARLEKRSIFGSKEVRVLKKLSKSIISSLKKVREVHSVDLSVGSDGLIKGSFVFNGLYEVSSEVKQGAGSILVLNFTSTEYSSKFSEQIFIQVPNPMGMLYIGVEPTNEPNLEEVPLLVKRILRSILYLQKRRQKQQERERSNQARIDREKRKQMRRDQIAFK